MAPKLLQANWEKDVVYLVQFPRAACCPSMSPYCLKLETWLRMVDIPYKNVKAGLYTRSEKGQLPFVELNGTQIADSYFIINRLSEHFQKTLESHLTDEEKSVARAFDRMIEGSLFWAGHELMDPNKMFEDNVMGKNISGWMKTAKPVLLWRMNSNLKSVHHAQGIGRHSHEEVVELAKADLKAISNFLAEKPFMTGDKPTRLDVTVFGHLAVMHFIPFETELKSFIDSECQNIVDYLNRIKTTYWPDWDDCINNLSLETDWKGEKKTEEEEKENKEEKKEVKEEKKEEQNSAVATESKE